MEQQEPADPKVMSDIEFSGVDLEHRERLFAMGIELFKQGLTRGEVRETLEEFIERKDWEPVSQNDALWIAHSAKEKVDQEKWQASQPVPEVETLRVVRMDEVTPEPVRWLWPGKIPFGRVTAIYGEAGFGKTRLGLELAARVSTGRTWPYAANAPEAGQVLILNGMDPVKASLHARLKASGANPQNVTVVEGVNLPGKAGGAAGLRRIDLGRDMPHLRQQLQQLGQVRLLIVDCLEECCGTGHVSQARLRSILWDLERLAQEWGVAIVVISAANRSDLPVKNIWRVDRDMMDIEQRCLVAVRFYEVPLPDPLAYRITEKGIGWGDAGDVPAADRLQGAQPNPERRRQMKTHMEWLRRHLLDGPQPARQVLAEARADGMSASQVKRAKQALKVMCFKENKAKGKWIWELPFQKRTGPVVGKVHVLGAIPPDLEEHAAWVQKMQQELKELGEEVE